MRKPSELDLLFRRAVADGTFSGASLLVRAASVGDIFFRSWGRTRKDGETVHAGTRFDLASLTKPLVTSPLCMWAVDRAEFGLEDPISRFFSRSQVPHDKRSITVRQLLNHRSGLPAYKPFYFKLLDVEGRNDKKTLLLSLLLSAPLVHPPGKAACYSDLGYMLLGLILERTLGAPLDILADRIDPVSTFRSGRSALPAPLRFTGPHRFTRNPLGRYSFLCRHGNLPVAKPMPAGGSP